MGCTVGSLYKLGYVLLLFSYWTIRLAEKCRDSRTQIDGYLTRKNVSLILRHLF
jgi:hypothetical protein